MCPLAERPLKAANFRWALAQVQSQCESVSGQLSFQLFDSVLRVGKLSRAIGLQLFDNPLCELLHPEGLLGVLRG